MNHERPLLNVRRLLIVNRDALLLRRILGGRLLLGRWRYVNVDHRVATRVGHLPVL